MDYLKNPAEIEQKSFQLIRAETDFSGFDEQQQQIVMRLVHTCGNPEIAQQVRISGAAIEAGIDALKRDCHVLCDVEMVKQGLTKRFLTRDPLCFLNHPETAELPTATQKPAPCQHWHDGNLIWITALPSSAMPPAHYFA